MTYNSVSSMTHCHQIVPVLALASYHLHKMFCLDTKQEQRDVERTMIMITNMSIKNKQNMLCKRPKRDERNIYNSYLFIGYTYSSYLKKELVNFSSVLMYTWFEIKPWLLM